MNKIILSIIAATTILAACNNSSSGKKDNTDSAAQTTAAPVDTYLKQIPAATVTNQAASIKEILADYLQMKNAFANDNTDDAAKAGSSLEITFKNFDMGSITEEQQKIFADVADDAKEHAEHIGANGGNIAHQREHFDMLSKDMADLIKTFGNGGQTLYKDFCPMYNNGKGAIWISETKEIKNPYLGKAMPTCGTMKEEMK